MHDHIEGNGRASSPAHNWQLLGGLVALAMIAKGRT